ncbi:MAG: hypothetical protein ACTTK1_07465 [Candidatus Cryptobacteroides sp.]
MDKFWIVWEYDSFSSEYYEIQKCATLEEANSLKQKLEEDDKKSTESYGGISYNSFSIEEMTEASYNRLKELEQERDKTEGKERMYRTYFE